jgi:membrane associated rhomboid family serine protease
LPRRALPTIWEASQDPALNSPRERIFNVPRVVMALMALLTLIHLGMAFGLTEPQTNDVLFFIAFTPLRYLSGVHLRGIPDSWLTTGLGPQIWTFVTYAFVHLNLNHLFFNLIWLLAFGAPVARRFGALRFLVFYAATAAAGALAHLIVHWGELSPMIGASAAVSGAMGAALRFVFQREGPLGLLGSGEKESYRVPAAPLTVMFRDPRALSFLAVWFGLNLLFGIGSIPMPGLEGNVAWEAHIGGFLAGLLGFGLFDPVRPSATPAEAEDATAHSDDLQANSGDKPRQ